MPEYLTKLRPDRDLQCYFERPSAVAAATKIPVYTSSCDLKENRSIPANGFGTRTKGHTCVVVSKRSDWSASAC